MSEGVSVDRLRSVVERIERLEAEVKGLNEDKSALYQEAKAQGFDLPALKDVIRLRRLDEGEQAQRLDLIELYTQALGTPVATRARAREAPAARAAAGGRSRGHDA